MSGRWFSEGQKGVQESRLRTALIQSTTGKKGADTGGSWGQGKKGVACASRIRTVAAYTCHPPHQDEEEVTRQFLGVTYWRSHSSSERVHRGLGLLGGTRQDAPSESEFKRYADLVPLLNDDADEFVHGLGIEPLSVRDPARPEDHGTSYLFVDPAFSAEDLAWAVSRNWWPLLERYGADIEIIDDQGEVVELAPRDDDALRPFLECFDVCVKSDTRISETVDRSEIDASGIRAGTLAVSVDTSEDGWSYDSPDTNTNLVALVRNDMVIAYQRFPKKWRAKPPFVRGTFVVSRKSDASKMLKMTEGHLHNSWKEDPQEVGSEGNAKFASLTLGYINDRVKALRKRFEEEDETSATRIRVFQILFSGKTQVQGPSENRPTGGGPREFVRDYGGTVPEYQDSDPTSLRLKVSASVALRPDHPEDQASFRIDPGWAVLEESGKSRDGTLGSASGVELPAGFTRNGGAFEGVLTKEPVEFTWVSDYFPDLWLVEPDLKLERIDGET
jgi:hypothetical protein